MPTLFELFESGFDLIGNTFATKLNAIVGEATRVAFRYKNVKIGEALLYASSKIFEVIWFAPEAEPCQQRNLVFKRGGIGRLEQSSLPMNKNYKVCNFARRVSWCRCSHCAEGAEIESISATNKKGRGWLLYLSCPVSSG